MIAAQYNARAIERLKKGKQAAWDYVKTEVPEQYRAGVISTLKTILKRSTK